MIRTVVIEFVSFLIETDNKRTFINIKIRGKKVLGFGQISVLVISRSGESPCGYETIG